MTNIFALKAASCADSNAVPIGYHFLGPARTLPRSAARGPHAPAGRLGHLIGNSRVPGYQVFNAALTYALRGDRLPLTGYVRNLSNEAADLGGMDGTFVPSFVSMSIAPPRTFGLRLSYVY